MDQVFNIIAPSFRAGINIEEGSGFSQTHFVWLKPALFNYTIPGLKPREMNDNVMRYLDKK
ncbi:MAG: hypothetical protein V4592_19065 [Bacteroidota bacterium]